MSDTLLLISFYVTLIICVVDAYSMNSYILTPTKVYTCLAATSLFCILCNSLVILYLGRDAFRTLLLFTTALPYFIVIVLVSKNKMSQTLFNLWLWISVYSLISYVAEVIDHFTFDSDYFCSALRITLLCVYFVVYNRHFKAIHIRYIETLNLNWWLFSFIPMTFVILIWVTKYNFKMFYGSSDCYHIIILIYILMLLVYSMIVYAFNAVQSSGENMLYAQSIKEQISLLERQYEFQLKREELERIFRHDQRFRNSILLNYLETDDIESAKAYIKKINSEMTKTASPLLCENALINATLTEYRTKAEQKGLNFNFSIQLPDSISCDESEFCVMLSNFLENSIEAAESYINLKIKFYNSQLSINIENDYSGTLKKDSSGWYVTTKPEGSGLGLKSANAILKKNRGFLKIDDSKGVFRLFATMKN